jgi:hypothetical protein
MADTPADARPPPELENNAEAGLLPPHGGALPAERVGGARVAPAARRGGAGQLEAAAAHPHPGGPLVGGTAAAFAAAPAAAKAALKSGHDAEVKASHGAGGATDPTHSNAGQQMGGAPSISGNNRIMDSRRVRYGVPQGRRTDG